MNTYQRTAFARYVAPVKAPIPNTTKVALSSMGLQIELMLMKLDTIRR